MLTLKQYSNELMDLPVHINISFRANKKNFRKYYKLKKSLKVSKGQVNFEKLVQRPENIFVEGNPFIDIVCTSKSFRET